MSNVMDKMKLANNLSRIDSLIPKAPADVKKPLQSDESGSFKETFENLISGETAAETKVVAPEMKVLDKNFLKFSNHAIERMQSRGISFNPDRLERLEDAVRKAAAKGSKDTLVLMDDSAAIISVKNNTVVTVMDKNNLKDNVFTNIDSTIVI